MKIITALFLVSLFVLPVQAERVFSVHDGDTFNIEGPQSHCFIKNRKPQKHQAIRILWLDTPELKQPYGNQSKYALSHLLSGQDVTLTCKGCSGARRLCHVNTVVLNVGRWMVRQGHGFDSPKYSKGAYAQDEAMAKQQGLGVWQLPNGGVRPWDWRHTSH